MQDHWQKDIDKNVASFVNQDKCLHGLEEEHKDFLREVREIRKKAVKERKQNTKQRVTTIDLLNLLNKQGYSYTNKFFLHLFDYLYSSDIEREYIIKFAQFCLTKIPAGFKELKHQNYAKIDMVSILEAAKDKNRWSNESDLYRTILYCNTPEKFITQCMTASKINCEVISNLLERKANPNALSIIGITPLMIAVLNSNFTLAKLLLEQKADVNLYNKAGYSAVHMICDSDFTVCKYYGPESSQGHDNMKRLNFLCEHKANLDLPHRESKLTPLHDVCIQGNSRIVEYLLTKGVSTNSLDLRGETSVHYACKNFNLQVFWSLMKYSSDFNVRNQSGKSPLDYLKRIRSSVTGPNFFTDILLEALRMNKEKLAEFAIKSSINVEARDNSGNTALHLVYKRKETKVALFLLEHKADPNAPNIFGETPLHEACRANNIQLVSLLLNYKGDPNIQNLTKEKPYDIAYQLDYKELLKLLSNNSKQSKQPMSN